MLHPFLKYPGGKTKEIPLVLKYYYKEAKRYIEPFVGGGSIYYAINIPTSFINDKSEDLSLIYSLIKEQNRTLYNYLIMFDNAWKDIESLDIRSLKGKYKSTLPWDTYRTYYNVSLKRKNKTVTKFESEGKKISKEDLVKIELTARKTAFYMIVRDIYNERQNDKYLHCATFYFLREYCYSSMFRFSKEGKFNVPYGGMSYNLKYLTKKIDYIFSNEMTKYMEQTTIGNEDFETFISKTNLTKHDFMFLDPPYDSDFSTYDNNAFDKKEQIRLRDCLKKTKAKWMLIIKKTDFIYDLYKDFNIFEYDMNYMVSFKNRNDKYVKHLLITNYEIGE